MKLENKIESILLFKNEPVSLHSLSKLLNEPKEAILNSINNLQEFYKQRGLVIILHDEQVSFGTNPELSKLIESILKEELSRDLGKAGLETLAIILYKGPISRREIDYIRGVNSGFIIRNLMVRGLIDRSEPLGGERSYSYKPTLELLKYLGITKIEDLPEFKESFSKLEDFSKTINDIQV